MQQVAKYDEEKFTEIEVWM